MTPEQQAAVNEARSVLRGMSPHIAERRSARALRRLLESVEAENSSDELREARRLLKPYASDFYAQHRKVKALLARTAWVEQQETNDE